MVKESRLSTRDLSSEQLEDLFRISLSVLSIGYHDLTNIVHNLQFNIQIIGGTIGKDKQAQSLPEDAVAAAISSLPLETAFAGMEKACNRLDRAFHHYFEPYRLLFRGDPAAQQIFIARPSDLVAQLRKEHSEVDFQVGDDSDCTLEIIFPENILYGVLSELAYNAKKSAHARACVLIRWSVQRDRFFCEVHDNGPGLAPHLGDRRVTLSAIVERVDVDVFKESGLAIIDRVMERAGGSLFISNSPGLGGSLVSFEFPVAAHASKATG